MNYSTHEQFASILSPIFFTPVHTPNSQNSCAQSLHSKSHQLPTNQKSNSASKVPDSRKLPQDQEKGLNRGHWLLAQNKKYHWFLELHYKHFVNRQMRRMDRIFKSMEYFIGSRQAEQCRSHHQKMQKKFHRFSAIIEHLRAHHYSSQELQPLMEDLKRNGHIFEDELANITALQAEEQLIPRVQLKQRKRSSNCKSEKKPPKTLIVEIEDQHKENQELCQEELPNPVNMLDQSNLNIGELMLYHDREENSGLFNFN